MELSLSFPGLGQISPGPSYCRCRRNVPAAKGLGGVRQPTLDEGDPTKCCSFAPLSDKVKLSPPVDRFGGTSLPGLSRLGAVSFMSAHW